MRSKKMGHTTVYKGKKILLFFRDGRKLVTKFIERKGRFVVTDAGRYTTEDVYRVSIYKSHGKNLS